MTETTVIIPHSSSTETLIAVLTQLQMQEVPPVHIYIIDCSADKSGLRIARKFSFNTVPISVEVRKGTIYENWNAGIELSQMDHPNANILIINDDVLLPLDAIAAFQHAANSNRDGALCFVPETPPKTHAEDYVNTYFQTKSSVRTVMAVEWMSGFVFYLPKKALDKIGMFDTRYQVWFGDNDYEERIKKEGYIGLVRGLYVYHYGSRSYAYRSAEVQQKISEDRKLFYNTYGHF